MPTRNTIKAIHSSLVFSFFTFLLPLAVIVITVSSVAAATWYVKPSAEVPIRSGKGSEFKILAVVPDGLRVDILEEEDPWAKVRTAGGTEGWMLKRYLSNDRPLVLVVDELEKQKSKLEEQGEGTSLQLEEVSAAHSQLEKEIAVCLAERDEIQTTYEALRKDTADVMKIKQGLAAKTQENLDLIQKLKTVEQQNNSLRRNTSLMWFLAGGGLLLIGWIIGMMTGKSRKRKSSLL